MAAIDAPMAQYLKTVRETYLDIYEGVTGRLVRAQRSISTRYTAAIVRAIEDGVEAGHQTSQKLSDYLERASPPAQDVQQRVAAVLERLLLLARYQPTKDDTRHGNWLAKNDRVAESGRVPHDVFTNPERAAHRSKGKGSRGMPPVRPLAPVELVWLCVFLDRHGAALSDADALEAIEQMRLWVDTQHADVRENSTVVATLKAYVDNFNPGRRQHLPFYKLKGAYRHAVLRPPLDDEEEDDDDDDAEVEAEVVYRVNKADALPPREPSKRKRKKRRFYGDNSDDSDYMGSD